MIKNFLRAAAVCAALSSGVVHASTYDFTYTFADGLQATGTLTGLLSGNSLMDITSETVSFNGVAFSRRSTPLGPEMRTPVIRSAPSIGFTSISACSARNGLNTSSR